VQDGELYIILAVSANHTYIINQFDLLLKTQQALLAMPTIYCRCYSDIKQSLTGKKYSGKSRRNRRKTADN